MVARKVVESLAVQLTLLRPVAVCADNSGDVMNIFSIMSNLCIIHVGPAQFLIMIKYLSSVGMSEPIKLILAADSITMSPSLRSRLVLQRWFPLRTVC